MVRVASTRGGVVVVRSTARARRQTSSRASARSVARFGTGSSLNCSWSRVCWWNSSSAMAWRVSCTVRARSPVSSKRPSVNSFDGDIDRRLRARSVAGSWVPSGSSSAARAVTSALHREKTVPSAASIRSPRIEVTASWLRSLMTSVNTAAWSMPMRPSDSASSTAGRPANLFAIASRRRATPAGNAARVASHFEVASPERNSVLWRVWSSASRWASAASVNRRSCSRARVRSRRSSGVRSSTSSRARVRAAVSPRRAWTRARVAVSLSSGAGSVSNICSTTYLSGCDTETGQPTSRRHPHDPPTVTGPAGCGWAHGRRQRPELTRADASRRQHPEVTVRGSGSRASICPWVTRCSG